MKAIIEQIIVIGVLIGMNFLNAAFWRMVAFLLTVM